MVDLIFQEVCGACQKISRDEMFGEMFDDCIAALIKRDKLFELVIEAEAAFDDLIGGAGDDFDNGKKIVNSACLRSCIGVSLPLREAAG